MTSEGSQGGVGTHKWNTNEIQMETKGNPIGSTE